MLHIGGENTARFFNKSIFNKSIQHLVAQLFLILLYLGYGISIQYKVFVASIVVRSIKESSVDAYTASTFNLNIRGSSKHMLYAGTKHDFQDPKRIQKLFQCAMRSRCQNYIPEQPAAKIYKRVHHI